MSKWTAEREADLTKMWADGLSGSQIGLRMGITRNAVIGKVHRLGLSGRAMSSETRRLNSARCNRGKARTHTAFGKRIHPSRQGLSERIRGLIRAGKSPPAIADELKIRVSEVHSVKKNMLPIEPLPVGDANDIARVSFIDLDEVEIDGSRQHCRFIPANIDPLQTKPWEAQFCGAKKLQGLSYCEAHAKRCLTPAHARPTPTSPRTFAADYARRREFKEFA